MSVLHREVSVRVDLSSRIGGYQFSADADSLKRRVTFHVGCNRLVLDKEEFKTLQLAMSEIDSAVRTW